MSESVSRLANRVAIDPFFLAFALSEYATAERLDEAGLAAALGIAIDVLPQVRLCPVPRPDPDGFRQDVDRIAKAFGLNRDVLATVARHGQAIVALRSTEVEKSAESGYLIAARDRPPS
jgi:hypothetical protein